MKKHIFRKVLAISIAGVLVLLAFLQGCEKTDVPASTKIENGLSAYELAVEYGYDGTIQEWIESLNGKSAYQIAVENGYSGNESEWLDSLNATANSVASIKNAEFNSKGELILTLSDNTVLNVGAAVGANGKDGADGKNGANGISITTAKINNDGQLVIEFSDGQSVNLDKVVGVNGNDGVSVTASKINSNGELVLIYSNGQEANLGVVIGAKGDKGDKGDAGVDGKDGIDTIISTAINANGELVITYSDGTSDNLGVVVGSNGQNGVDGQDGISITDAEINSAGELVLTYSNNQRSNLGMVIGADGRDGQNGTDGFDGVDGQDGIGVKKSEINSRGELVITYSDNTVDNLGVVVGTNGQDGRDGIDGVDGQNGEDGVGIETIVINDSDELVITLTNNSTLNLGCIKGADGQDGQNGIDGQNGRDGADGQDGISVTDAVINDSNELVLSFSDETNKNLGVVVGADGRSIKKTEVNALGELVITYTDNTTDNLGVIIRNNGGVGASVNAPRVRINSETNEWEISIDGGITYVSTGVKSTGNDGQDGTDGEDGKTPYIKDGNWWIGDINTNVKAEGVDGANGQDGEDGVGVSGAEINNKNHLIIKLSDNTTIDVGVVVGSDGKDGTNGKDGVGVKDVTVSDEGILTITLDNNTVLTLGNIKGKDGVGISKSEINSEGELVITYTDDKVVVLGKVTGNDGIGIKSVELTNDYKLKLIFTNGENQTVGPIRGEKGADGVGIDNISIGADGYLYVTYSNNGEPQKIAYIKGNKGDPGVDGKTPYILNGTWWIGETNTGIKAEGTDGTNGVGIQNAYINSESHLIIVLTNETEIDAGKVGSSESSVPLEKFTVTFKDHDGTVLKTEEVESGKAATAPSNPSRTGYTFTGWNQPFSNVIAEMVVVAQYQKITKPTFEVANVTSSAGSTGVEVAVTALNNPGVAGMTLSVEYDDKVLTLSKVSNSDVLSGLTFQKPKNYKNGCNLVWYGSEPDKIIDGEAFVMKFDVVGSITSGTYPIKLIYSNGTDVNLESVVFEVVNGSIIIP